MKRIAYIYLGKKFAGILEEKESGSFIFTYDKAYLNKKNFPISLNLPLREESYVSDRLFPFFDGLIPEGWLLNLASKNWKLNARDRMGLLLASCQDCIGAVSVYSEKQAFHLHRGHNGK